METNPILDAPETETNLLAPTTPEKWADYAEYIPLVLFPIGYIFKIQSWVYGEEIITWSILFYAALLFFLPSLVVQGKGVWQNIISYFLGFGFFALLMGGLFEIQSWQYAQEMVIVATFVMPFMAVVAFIVLGIKYKQPQSRRFAINILVRIFAFGIIGLLFGSFIVLFYKIVKPFIFKEK